MNCITHFCLLIALCALCSGKRTEAQRDPDEEHFGDRGPVYRVRSVRLLCLLAGVKSSPAWNLADALSEEAADQGSSFPPRVKPVVVASSSRLVAFLGMSVILSLYQVFGCGYLWEVATNASSFE